MLGASDYIFAVACADQQLASWIEAHIGMVEFYGVAAHARSRIKGGFTTDPAHRPKAHEKHLDWTPSHLIRWARTIGPQCGQAVTHILENKPHPEQGYRSCRGILRLAKGYGHERMEAACRRALALDAVNYPRIASILKTKVTTRFTYQSLKAVSDSSVSHADWGNDFRTLCVALRITTGFHFQFAQRTNELRAELPLGLRLTASSGESRQL